VNILLIIISEAKMMWSLSVVVKILTMCS